MGTHAPRLSALGIIPSRPRPDSGHAATPALTAWPSVLLVDDDSSVRAAISRVLATEALEVNTARGVKDALEQIHRHVPDLVITDLRMAPLSGWDLIAYLKLRYPRLPIFVITAQRPLFAGDAEGSSDALFQKPLDFDALLAAIRQRLCSSRGNRETAPPA